MQRAQRLRQKTIFVPADRENHLGGHLSQAAELCCVDMWYIRKFVSILDEDLATSFLTDMREDEELVNHVETLECVALNILSARAHGAAVQQSQSVGLETIGDPREEDHSAMEWGDTVEHCRKLRGGAAPKRDEQSGTTCHFGSRSVCLSL